MMNQLNHKALKLFNNLSNTVQNKANKVYAIYENYFGIKELKDIQHTVLNAEKTFTDASKARREVQANIMRAQDDLKRLRKKLDSTNRADENYLTLLTEEHKLIKQEFNLGESLRRSEEDEREKFTFFSNRLRESQDFEKIRQEKLKYISLIGSVIGALLGIIATSINHNIRRRDLSNLTESISRQANQDKEINLYTSELKKIVDQLESKLGQTSDFSQLNNEVLNELRSINSRLISLNSDKSLNSDHSIQTTDSRKLNFMLVGLTLLSISVLYDLFGNKMS